MKFVTKLNYENPTIKDYLRLLDLEAFLVQIAELHVKNGFHDERRIVLQEKKRLSVHRVCMKAALNLKGVRKECVTHLAI